MPQAAYNGEGTDKNLPGYMGVSMVWVSHDNPILAEIVRRLVEAYQPERIYLFGSVAREEASANSDYDLLIVVPDDAPPERRTSRLGYQALRGNGVAVDVVVWDHSRFEKRAKVASSLPASVLREGRLLYAA